MDRLPLAFIHAMKLHVHVHSSRQEVQAAVVNHSVFQETAFKVIAIESVSVVFCAENTLLSQGHFKAASFAFKTTAKTMCFRS